MSRVISTKTIAKGVDQTVTRRTRRVVIDATADGRYRVTAEREDVAEIGGQQVGGTTAAPYVTLEHDAVLAHPDFASVQKAIAAAIDQAEEAEEKARAEREAATLAFEEARAAQAAAAAAATATKSDEG